MYSFSSFRLYRWVRTWGIVVLAGGAAAACGPVYSAPREVEANPPKVSYNYSTDQQLVEASAKARIYCSKYASTPGMNGSITENPDGTKTVTYECVKTGTVTLLPPPPPPPPMSYSFTTDMELLQAIQSADAYCARTGQAASSSINANPDGTKTLTFQCVPR